MFSYIPLSYTFHSRIKTKSERISWFLIFPLYLFLVSIFFNFNLFIFFASFFSVMSIYEVGYLFNDLVTTKKESNPTIRSSKKTEVYEENFYLHIIFRLIFSLIISYFIYIFTDSLYSFLSIILISLFYYIHNTIRSKINIISYFLLVSCRYIFPIYLSLDFSLFIFILLSFPLCRTLEHCCKRKYNMCRIKKLVGNIDLFRLKYYVLLSLIYIITYFSIESSFFYIILSIYFLFVRIASLILRKKVNTNKHPSY